MSSTTVALVTLLPGLRVRAETTSEYQEPDWVWKLREHSYVPEPGAAR
jgi:hypothetical protein